MSILAISMVTPVAAQERLILSLEESMQLALERNKTLAASRLSLGEARAKVGEARTNFLPKLSGSANYTRLDVAPFMPGKIFGRMIPDIPGMPSMGEIPKRITIGRDEIMGIGMTLQQPLFTGFQILNSYRMANDGLKATEANYEKDKNDLILEVEKAYWGVITAQNFVEVSQEGVKQMEAYIRDLQNMFDVGMLTKNDLLKAKVQLSNVRLMEIQARNGEKLARKAFCNLLGIPLTTELHLSEELTSVVPEKVNLEEAVQQALFQRPEVRMMNYSTRIGQRAVDIASAGWLPNLALVLEYGYQKPDREYNPDFYTTWTLSVVAQMNLFDWGATHYKKAQAQRQLSQIKENLEALKSGIILEVTQAALKLKEAEERITLAQENVAQAEENYKVTRDQFNEGMVTNTEVLDANTLLVQAKTDYISALADYKIAQAQMDRAIGKND